MKFFIQSYYKNNGRRCTESGSKRFYCSEKAAQKFLDRVLVKLEDFKFFEFLAFYDYKIEKQTKTRR